MNARCTCTMQPIGPQASIKPYGDYYDPDPNCEKCNGTGFFEVTILEDEIVAVRNG